MGQWEKVGQVDHVSTSPRAQMQKHNTDVQITIPKRVEERGIPM